MPEEYKPKIESDDDRLDKAFIDFIGEHNCTAHEIREAYYRLCGVIDNEHTSERVKAIEERMEEMTKARYPLNRFVRFVGAVEKCEDSTKDFDNFVSTLAVSDKEKILLKSIVGENRSGELECRMDDKIIAQIKILNFNSKEVLAIALSEKLKELIQRVGTKNLSFWFEEK